MAASPQNDMSVHGESCFSFLHFCDNIQSSDGTAVDNHQKKAPIICGYHNQTQQTHDKAEMKETEEFLAGELTKLSVQDRDSALDDLHCVGRELQETTEMIQQSLVEFDHFVQTSANRIYSVAVNQNRAYVEDSQFRLKFLRANLHDARQAVHQMMTFLEQKAIYFGEDKVARDIVPSDLDEEEIELMRSGFFQILDGRDRNGRVIMYNSFTRIPTRFIERIGTQLRVMYHIIFNNLIPIPEVQTKGAVLIYYDESKGGDRPNLPGINFFSTAKRFGDSFPFQISSLHLCLHSSPGSLALHNRMLQFLLKSAPHRARVRARLHYGSDLERQYKLRGYGISLDTFPVDKDGNIRPEIQHAWCREYLEASPAGQQASHENTGIGGIRETDILFGRGRLVQYHPGNIRFRTFLGEHIEEYESLHRFQRRKACVDYIAELAANGARFFKEKGNNVWVVCEFEEAVDKALQFFRSSRYRNKK